MKKLFVVFIMMMLLMGCAISSTNGNAEFEEKAGTQVAIALTATALDQYFAAQTEEVVEEETRQAPSPTQTESVESEAKLTLGTPTYTDSGSTLSAWSADPVDEIVVEGITTFSIDNGRLAMQSSQTGKFHWRLNYQEFADGYLEAKFETGNCSGNDQYGLIFRAPDYSNGVGYYFTMTCDGHYGLREKTDPNTYMNDAEMIIPLTESDKINAGANQVNILGVQADGSSLKLYMNDELLDEISNANLTNTGHMGVYIYARQTAGFTVYLDEISFWNANN